MSREDDVFIVVSSASILVLVEFSASQLAKV